MLAENSSKYPSENPVKDLLSAKIIRLIYFLSGKVSSDKTSWKVGEEAGIIPFQIGVSSQNYVYPLPEKFRWYAETYQKGLWRGLGKKDFNESNKSP